MAEAKPKAKPKGKTFLGLSPVYWVVAGTGAVVGYMWYRAHKASAAANASTALTGGSGIPSFQAVLPTSQSPNTLGQWIQQAISQHTTATYSATAAMNDITAWLLGNCVSSSGYSMIGDAVSTLGLPPGYNTVPAVTPCPQAASTTPPAATPTPATATPTVNAAPSLGADPTLLAAMMNNGEHIVSEQFDSVTNTWLYLTNKGGVYTDAAGRTDFTGGTFYGSFLGLNPYWQQVPAGSQFDQLQVNSDGGYTLYNTAGESYTFGPGRSPQGPPVPA